MEIFEPIWDEKKRKSKISKELRNLRQIFAIIDESHSVTVEGLIESAAFQRVAIQELELTIRRDGFVEEYMNGANQFGIKKSAAVETYDKMVNTYCKIIKQLCDLLPEDKAADPGEELMSFISRKSG